MRELSIAYGASCHAKQWSNKTITFDELCERLQNTIRTPETVEDYKKMKKSERDQVKDKGGFVAGSLKGGRRKIEAVVCRSMLSADVDEAPKGFIDNYVSKAQYASCLYTTHSHTPTRERIRIIVPLTRDVTPEEYTAISRYFAKDWGIDYFDVCSYKPNQLMYWPTTPTNGEYVFKRIEGDWLDPDEVLAEHPEWRDISLLPTNINESVAKAHNYKKQQNPLEKKGVVGAYCRAHSITDVIEYELSDIYERSANNPSRYDFKKGESTAGVVIYEDMFAYSHHATDPAGGRLLNAFDLVRIHRFGDDKDSVSKMIEFALNDSAVNMELFKEKQEQASKEFENWEDGLERDKRGNIVNSLGNLQRILEHDENLTEIRMNRLADNIEVGAGVPWVKVSDFWRDEDDAQLVCYVDKKYGTFSARNFQIAVTKVSADRGYHPIIDYFNNLPEWDGIRRVDSLLIDYLGAVDNAYVRAVTRKTLCAAVARIYHPGIKFDSILVFNGPQGIGKSTFIFKLGGDWYSDSLSLTDMNDKTAAEKLQGYWLMEIGELAGMKKADVDRVKAFISRQDDKYRASYGRRVISHPRQCVFFGTTNTENGYLRDITGNRRFWNVKTPGGKERHPWELTNEEVRQIWAEALVLYRAGEKLFLDADLEVMARDEQSEALEYDDREGLVQEYLDTLLPDNWNEMDVYSRREFLEGGDNPTIPVGTAKRNEVCNMEIWCECFGKRKEDMTPSDSYRIAAIMSRLKEWEKSTARMTFPIYGRQRIYVRKGQKAVHNP